MMQMFAWCSSSVICRRIDIEPTMTGMISGSKQAGQPVKEWPRVVNTLLSLPHFHHAGMESHPHRRESGCGLLGLESTLSVDCCL